MAFFDLSPDELASYAPERSEPDDFDAFWARTFAEHGAGEVDLVVEPVDTFLTVSAWASWDDVTRATGGDVHRPLATRKPERLVDWDVVYDGRPRDNRGAKEGNDAALAEVYAGLEHRDPMHDRLVIPV